MIVNNGNTLKKRHYRSWFSTGILDRAQGFALSPVT
jgi:hypothetical protein